MSPSRFRIRTLMIAVVVAALVSWVIRDPTLVIALIAMASVLLILAAVISHKFHDRYGPPPPLSPLSGRRWTHAKRLPCVITRRWALAVTAVALTAGAAARLAFLERRDYYRSIAAGHRVSAEYSVKGMTEAGAAADLANISLYRRKAEFHRELRRKYEAAARHPWLPLSPDPPEPK
jgi:hypothetical protein